MIPNTKFLLVKLQCSGQIIPLAESALVLVPKLTDYYMTCNLTSELARHCAPPPPLTIPSLSSIFLLFRHCRLSIASAHAFLLVYSVTDPTSFASVKSRLEEIKEQRNDFEVGMKIIYEQWDEMPVPIG